MIRRALRVIGVLFAMLLVGTLALSIRTPGRQARWLAEYEAARHYLATNDANFDWVVAKRQLDLGTLDRETRHAVEGSWTAFGAAWSVRSFIWKFQDGHTWARIRPNIWWRGVRGGAGPDVSPEEIRSKTGPALTPSMSATEVCGLVGLKADARPDGWDLPWPEYPGAELHPNEEFPAVVVPLPDGRKVGILRIATFGHEHYGPTCASTWKEFQEHFPENCQGEGDCHDHFVTVVMRGIAYRGGQVADSLARLGVAAIVVDITGNGGGSEIADGLARALTGVNLKLPPIGFVRGPHHLRALTERREALVADTGRVVAAEREILLAAIAHLDRDIAEAGRECARDRVWRGRLPLCSNTVVTLPLVDYALPIAFPMMENRWALYPPSATTSQEGAYSGPLVVLQDRHSASASEEFAARLRDNEAAKIVGERSYGAGCGYTNGGTRLELEALGLLIRAPDCQRLRRDGTNETEGIPADIEAGWTAGDSPRERMSKAVTAVTVALGPSQ